LFNINKQSGFIQNKLIKRVVILIGIYSIYWFGIAYVAQNRLHGISGSNAASGVELEFSDVKISGFPLTVYLNLPDVNTQLSRDDAIFSLQASQVTIGINPLNPLNIVIKSIGPSFGQLEYDDFSADYNRRILDAEIGSFTLVAGISLGDENISDLEIDIVDLTPSKLLTNDFQQIQLSVSADFPNGLPKGLTQSDIEQWQQNDGTIDDLDINMDYGPLSVAGKGSVKFDSKMTVVASSNFKVQALWLLQMLLVKVICTLILKWFA